MSAPKQLVVSMKTKLSARPLTDDGLDFEVEEPAAPGTQPFDLSELDKLPQPTDDDPPYRPWWVVDKS
jgi:hypothetical protein